METQSEQNGRLATTDYVLSNERVVVPAGAVGTPSPQIFALLLQSRPVGRYGKELVMPDCLWLTGVYTGQVRMVQINGY